MLAGHSPGMVMLPACRPSVGGRPAAAWRHVRDGHRRRGRPDWPRSAVMDASESCPACDSAGVGTPPLWDEVRPTDESRGASGPDLEPIPFVVCRTCGHEHSVGAWFTAVGDDHEHDPEERERLIAAAQAQMADRIRAPLGNSSLPPYAGPGWPRRLGGWSSGGSGRAESELTSVTVDHGAAAEREGPLLSVQTSVERDDFASDTARARSMLRGLLGEGFAGLPDHSRAGQATWLYLRERELLRLTTIAPVAHLSVLVDGQPVRFPSRRPARTRRRPQPPGKCESPSGPATSTSPRSS